jgi:hypothetical protein
LLALKSNLKTIKSNLKGFFSVLICFKN